jgi:hypothetical protein
MIDFKNRSVKWNLMDSKLYVYYILLHEIGHIKYCEEILIDSLAHKTSLKEEKFCDKYSMEIVKEIKEELIDQN